MYRTAPLPSTDSQQRSVQPQMLILWSLKNPADITLNHNMKVNITNKRINQDHVLPEMMHWEKHINFIIFLPKKHILYLIKKKTSDKLKLRDALQNKWHVSIKSVNIVKDKHILKNCCRLKEAKNNKSKIRDFLLPMSQQEIPE